MLTPTIRMQERIRLVRRRELALNGVILGAVGDWVNGDQVVARADRPGEIDLCRLSESLGIDPDDVAKFVKVKVGDRVTKDQVICHHNGFFGLFSASAFSPCDGVVEFFTERTGHLGIRHNPKEIAMKAYVSGVVREVQNGKSLLIESEAAFIQGIFGVGGERFGKITVLSVGSDREIEVGDLPQDCHGLILVGGSRPKLDTLVKASERGAVGLVCGSIDAATLRGFVGHEIGVAVTGDESISLSLIISEGFGSLPISDRALNILKACEGRDAAINGTTQVRAGAVRPEIVVCYPEQEWRDQVKDENSIELEIGSRVRLIRYPYFGQLARVASLPAELQKLETGSYARVLECEFENGECVVVPRANVELLSARGSV